jgi:hypothetical protein
MSVNGTHGRAVTPVGVTMEAPAIRRLIREKLTDCRLQNDSMPRFLGGPGNEQPPRAKPRPPR